MKAATENQSERSPVGNRRILIADNNKAKFTELTTALKEANVDVVFCNDRSQIVQMAMQNQPDVVLINLFMNSATTLSIIREIKGGLERQGTKILVITAHKSRENIAQCIQSGANDFVIDPFDTRQLLQRVRYQLQEREAYSPDDLRSEPTQVLAGFQLVYDCLRILAEIRDNHRALFECLKRISDLSTATRVNLMLADIENNQAVVLASSDDPKLQDLSVDLEKYPEVREVALKGCIVYVKDITTNPLTKEIKQQVKSIEINSLLVFPIRHRQETLGTLTVRLGSEGLAVSDKHLKTFYMVALCLAPKVATRKLLKKIQSEKA